MSMMKTIGKLSLKNTPLVLLVEDDPDEAALIHFHLNERVDDAFQVVHAASLAEVQNLAESMQSLPDVVLLDLNLPDSSGINTVIRCRELLGEVPVVVHTGWDDIQLTEAAIEAGADDYLRKGVESWMLRKSLRYAMLRHERDEQERLVLSVFHHASEGIMLTDLHGQILDVNDSFTRITGYSREEAISRTPALLKSGHHDKDFYRQLWQQLLNTGQWQGEIWNRRKNGEVFVEYISINAVRNARGAVRHFVCLFSDISLQKEQQLHLQHLAWHDALTGLPNRTLLLDRLQQAMAQVRRNGGGVGVVFLDLDGFKAVNDSFGHDAGDFVLQQVAERIKKCLREEDTLARLGGDEFVLLLLDQKDLSAVLSLLQRLLKEVADPIPWKNGASLKVSASLGVAMYPQSHAQDSENLLQQADHAMYQAKHAGKNGFAFYESDRHGGRSDTSLERAI